MSLPESGPKLSSNECQYSISNEKANIIELDNDNNIQSHQIYDKTPIQIKTKKYRLVTLGQGIFIKPQLKQKICIFKKPLNLMDKRNMTESDTSNKLNYTISEFGKKKIFHKKKVLLNKMKSNNIINSLLLNRNSFYRTTTEPKNQANMILLKAKMEKYNEKNKNKSIFQTQELERTYFKNINNKIKEINIKYACNIHNNKNNYFDDNNYYNNTENGQINKTDQQDNSGINQKIIGGKEKYKKCMLLIKKRQNECQNYDKYLKNELCKNQDNQKRLQMIENQLSIELDKINHSCSLQNRIKTNSSMNKQLTSYKHRSKIFNKLFLQTIITNTNNINNIQSTKHINSDVNQNLESLSFKNNFENSRQNKINNNKLNIKNRKALINFNIKKKSNLLNLVKPYNISKDNEISLTRKGRKTKKEFITDNKRLILKKSIQNLFKNNKLNLKKNNISPDFSRNNNHIKCNSLTHIGRMIDKNYKKLLSLSKNEIHRMISEEKRKIYNEKDENLGKKMGTKKNRKKKYNNSPPKLIIIN